MAAKTSVWLLFAALAGCARPAPPPVEAPSEARPEPPPVSEPTQTVAAVRWSTHFVRPCRGSITEPIVSADGRQVVLCNSRFSIEHGRYEGRAPLGVMALLETTAITDDYGGGGVSLRSLDAEDSPLRHAGKGRPELVVASARGVTMASVTATDDGRWLTTWTLPELEPIAEVSLGHGPAPLAIAIDDDGRALWYGDGSEGRAAYRLDASGHVQHVAEVPADALAAAFDRRAGWIVGIGPEGRRWVQPVDDADRRVLLPGRSAEPDWPGLRLALTADATSIAIADADDVEVWRREDAQVQRVGALEHAEVGALWLSDDGRTLMLTKSNDLTVLRTEPAPERSPIPVFAPPPPDGWEQAATRADGTIEWDDPGATIWWSTPGIVSWYRNDEGTDFRVVHSDRAQFDYPDASVEDWAQAVLERLDQLPGGGGASDEPHPAPHILRHWVEDGERRFEQHYTTVGGCEQYQVSIRVEERGEWIVRYEMRSFAPLPWRAGWAAFVEEPLGKAPSAGAI